MKNSKELKDALFNRLVEAYRDELQTTITQPSYWGEGFGTTHRKGSGETVTGGYRNIVDYGDIRDGQRDRQVGEHTQEFSWTSDHITEVVFGTRNTPGRNFPRRAAEKLNIQHLID